MTTTTATSNPSTRRPLRAVALALAVVFAGLSLFAADAWLGPVDPASACVSRGNGDGCRGPRLHQTQAEEEESNRMSSGRPNRVRRRQSTPAQREAARRAACEAACGEETADMLNRALNDAEGTRIADAYGRACMRACDTGGTE